MASRNEIVTFLDSYLEKETFDDCCPLGLQVEGRDQVKKVATAVSACVEVLELAARWGADMVLVHHGILWNKSAPILCGHYKERVKRLLDGNMSLVAYHLPLDAHPEVGNNALFAREMGLRDIEPFGEYHGHRIGWRGKLDPTPIGDFVAKAEAFYQAKPIAFLDGKPKISSAAVVSGGGWQFIANAARAGIDCFVTGAADEPAFHLAREENIHFLAFGHYATERVGVRRLGRLIAEKFDVEARFMDVDNPL